MLVICISITVCILYKICKSKKNQKESKPQKDIEANTKGKDARQKNGPNETGDITSNISLPPEEERDNNEEIYSFELSWAIA